MEKMHQVLPDWDSRASTKNSLKASTAPPVGLN